MSPQNHLLTAALALFVIFPAGCDPFKGSTSSHRKGTTAPCTALVAPEDMANLISDPAQDEEAARAGILAIGNEMIQDLCGELNATYDSTVVSVIAEGAAAEMNTAVGTLIITETGIKARSWLTSDIEIAAPTVVAAPIIRGAFLRLSDPRADLLSSKKRVDLAKHIISGTSAALKGRTSEMTTEETLDVLSEMTYAAVTSLPGANLVGDNAKESVSAVALTAVGALPEAGLESASIGSGARMVAEGAVAALGAPGFEPDSLGSLSGDVAGSALQGLSAAGLSAETIMQSGAIDLIISGAASGLSKNNMSTASAMDAMGSIAGAAVGVLSKVGLNTPELRNDALKAVVKSSMNGAQSLAANSSESLADAMSAVANQAVLALSSGGFETDQIGSAVSAIVESGIAQIAEAGITDAAFATQIASRLIEGALTGAGSLMQSGAMDAEKGTEAILAASTGAVKGLESLQTAGIITGDSVTTFTNSIAESVTSGLEKGGATAEVVASAQNTVTTLIQSDEVQGGIQANAGTAEAVATPISSVAGGAYSAAISIALSTTTSGATLRYTVDGSTPTSSHGILYLAPISLATSKTLKVIAYKTGWAMSEVYSVTYTISIAMFANAVTVNTGANPEGVAAGDLNGDGKIDLAVALYTGKGVSHLLGNGDGTFATKQDVANSPNSLGSFASINSAMIAMEDVGNDSKPDVIWGAWGTNMLSVLTNTTSTNASTLTFANNMPTGYSPGVSGPRAVTIADIDADGLKDIVMGEGNGNKLVIYLNQSGTPGTFVIFGTTFLFNPDSSIYTGNTHPWTVAVADFNNDSKPDVVTGGGFGGIVSVILNNTTVTGTPAFQTANRINTNTAFACTNNATVSPNDFNGDGKQDFIAACPTAGTDKVGVFINTTTTSATAATFTASSFDTMESMKSVTSGDVNGDGKADILVIAAGAPDSLN
ncbi:MAG: FG-GAP-like repeat-containing protein, partial [Pseudobdellovibrionaceae bacterium]|nr:FG-GAP-like repeat-containing protein [Pseudobdellovibrionaceae bacterium]